MDIVSGDDGRPPVDGWRPTPGRGTRGVWYQIGGAYSGGMATYPQHQMPMAVYAEATDTTYFVYGGEPSGKKGNLQIMLGAYDHARGLLANPTLVRDCSTGDAHANPCMAIDPEGHIYIYAAARHRFPGRIYRSTKPYGIRDFEQIVETYMPYPQAWITPDGRHFLKFTKYRGGRQIHWTTSPDGRDWDFDDRVGHLAKGGHYAMTFFHDGKVLMAMNWHRKGSDNRTNLYFVLTTDLGETWRTVTGEVVETPMRFPGAPGLVRDYHAEGEFIYLNDILVDQRGMPVLLYVVASGGSKTEGPDGDPRVWTTARWTGSEWQIRPICRVDHNYDYGNLRIAEDGKTWRAIGPTALGPHPYTTGGDIVLWTSGDGGETWADRQLTASRTTNHSFVRIPVNQRPDFFAYWADGDTTERSQSHHYFCTDEGEVFRMPRRIGGAWAEPERAR